MPGPNMEAAILSDKELCARLVSLAEHSHPDKLSIDSRAFWRLVCKEAAERLLARPEARVCWRHAKSDELPIGPPVEPGTTLYAFRHMDEGHWEYDLPPLPQRGSST